MTTRYQTAWPLWLKAHQDIVARIERDLADARLPALAWYDVLWALEQAPHGKLRMADLADEVLLTRSTLTRLTDRLEDAGLLRREPVPEDRRGYFATITDKGRAMRARMWPVYRKSMEKHFESRLKPADLAALHGILARLLDNLD